MKIDLKAILLLSLFFSHAAVAGFQQINGGMVNKTTVITSAAGTTTLVATSNQSMVVEGSTTQTIKFPDATLLPINWWYEIINNSTGAVAVQDNGSTELVSIGTKRIGRFLMTARASAAGTWKKAIFAGLNDVGTFSGNAATADALAATPTPCGAGEFVTGIEANGDAICGTPTGGGDVTGPASSTANAIARFSGTGGKTLKDTASATIDDSGNITATSFTGAVTGNVTGDVTGNADTATALAANPSDCASNEFASASAANGDLTCSSIPNAATTATASAGNSTIVARDGSGNFAAGTITAALTGNASTATALAANPADCSSNQFSNAIAANGDLTCAQPAFSDLSGAATSAQLPGPAASAISALDIDWSLRLKTGGFYTKTLSANTTLTFSNVDDGCINIRLTNTASNYTVTWPAMEWPEDTAPTQTVGAKSDVYVICNDGTNTFGSVVQDYHF